MMAKEEKEPKPKGEREANGKGDAGGKGGKKKKMHLHEIRSVQAHDGTIVHHHTYKESKESPYTMPERGPVATSASPEEAGQHVQEQFAMNGAEPEGGDAGAGEGGGDPGAGGGAPQMPGA
jgi:hypothetical protein